MVKKTLRDYILDGSRLRGLVCIGVGAKVTAETPQGIKQDSLLRTSESYTIRDLVRSAPWNPNVRRATLLIEYFEDCKKEYTYLDERFNDEPAGWE